MSEEYIDYRPNLLIPYWTNEFNPDPPDNGLERPLPSKVISYMCSGIHTSTYMPGDDLTVKVDVANFGDADSPALAQVAVWWSDPTTGFVVDPSKLIGVGVIQVRPRGMEIATAGPFTKRIPASAPAHICLLARVSHQLDQASAIPDPINDKHWAQRNLMAVSVQPGQPVLFNFFAANPLLYDAEFALQVRPVAENQMQLLVDEFQAEPVFVDAHFTLTGNQQSAEDILNLPLVTGERCQIQMRIELGSDLQQGQFTAFHITQTHGDQLVGDIGLAVMGS